MSSRYIARRYGTEPNSRASMARDFSGSRPPSRGPPLSRPPSRGAASSRGPSVSRGASPTPSYYYNGSGPSSGRSTPISRGCTPNPPGGLTSRRLRERSIPPPGILPERIEPVRPPPPPGKPPPAPARVVASDFYRGKVKSIYEREPLFKDFCQTIPQRYGPINIYNTGTLDTLKSDFKTMVEDKWKRKTLKDPSVEMNFGAKAYAWGDLAMKSREKESTRIFREQSSRPRGSTPVNFPRVYVYHRSTMSPAPQ